VKNNLIYFLIYFFSAVELMSQADTSSFNDYKKHISSFCLSAIDSSKLNSDRKVVLSAFYDLRFSNYIDCKTKLEGVLKNSNDTLLVKFIEEWYGNVLFYLKDYKSLSDFLDTNEQQKDYNFKNIIRSFSNAPVEKCVFNRDSTELKIKFKYQSKNPTISVKVNSKNRNAMFDTGAGISIVSESFARKNGIILLDTGKSFLKSASNNLVEYKAGLISELIIGGLTIYNHPVGIIADQAMEFKRFGIKLVDIDFVIGWPIIQELAVTINYGKKCMMIQDPDKCNHSDHNLFWYNIPIVKANLDTSNTTLYFELDLGGAESNIYEPIFTKVHSSQCHMKLMEFGGLGGYTTYTAKILPKLVIRIANTKVEFNTIRTRPQLSLYETFSCDGVLGGNFASHKTIYINAKKGSLLIK
jgi:hypothetical protein